MSDDFEHFFAMNGFGGVDEGNDATNGPEVRYFEGDEPPIPPVHGSVQPRQTISEEISGRGSRRKIREIRRRKKRRHMMMAVIACVAVIALIAAGLWGYRAAKGLAHNLSTHDSSDQASLDYPGPGTGSVQFEIASGESISSIADKLQKAGVVKSASAFASAVGANNSTLYPGTFMLKKKMSSTQVIAILSNQKNAGGVLQIKSGERISQVLSEAAKASGIDIAQFQQLQQPRGEGILPAEANGSFEGWLEPGSYLVGGKSNAADVLKPAVDARIKKLDSLGAPSGAQRENLLIIASIAESEVNSSEYYGKVARVILNRIAANMPLGMDSTVAYGFNVEPNDLTDAMLSDGSNAYNTRINPGLPPTPISSPSDDALQAALAPEQGDWLYFVTTNLKTGETKFTDSDQEFMKLRQEYKDSNSDAN